MYKRLKDFIKTTFSKDTDDQLPDSVRAHLCQRKEWKEGSAVVCSVCRGDGMDFIFKDRFAFEQAHELKEIQMDKKAS